MTDAPGSATRGQRLRELAGLFLRLGFTAFGGPAAHIAMMEDEVVARRQWLTREEFVDLLGATNLIPGPNSTEMAIHIGHRRAGWAGLLVAGLCFITPAAFIVAALAWVYTKVGTIPQAVGMLRGVKPVVLAIVVQALVRLGKTVVTSWAIALVGVVAAVASACGVHELAVLALGGLLVAIVRSRARPTASLLIPLGGLSATTASAGLGSAGLLPLFLVFAKIGSVLFGSGYVLLAFLRSELVDRHHWLSNTQLLDAFAVGQVTPGPVFTTATFIGWILRGPTGALVATLGIFLPSFVFVAISGPLVPRLRRSPLAGAILDGVNVASLALIVVVSYELGRVALVDAWMVGLGAASLAVLLATKLNSVWLIAMGTIIGLLAPR